MKVLITGVMSMQSNRYHYPFHKNNTDISSYAFAGNKSKVDEILDKRKDIEDTNEAIICYAFGGHTYYVDDLLDKAVDKDISRKAALRAYALVGNIVKVNALLAEGVDINEAIYCYAFVGNEDQVNKLLGNDTSITSAHRGYVNGYHKDKSEALLRRVNETNNLLMTAQYKKQNKHRIIRIAIVVLAAILLTPLSLLLSIPLLFSATRKAELNNPIKKLVTSKDECDAVKAKRKALRIELKGKDKKTKDFDKPKKVLISKNGAQVVYLVDKAQLARFRLFSIHEQAYLNDNKQKIKEQVKASKAESKQIMRALGNR